MDYENQEDVLASFNLRFTVKSDHILDQFTPMEIYLGESLLTPGLQTSIVVHNDVHYLPIKNLDEFKGVDVEIDIVRPILKSFNMPDEMNIKQIVYRLEKRTLYNNSTESLILHACDQSMLNDASTLVSDQWKCSTPSEITEKVLRSCVGVKNLIVEPSMPPRPYIAENIRPFQIVSQQANAALADGTDPSFVHYMTYENFGTHNFRSLKKLVQQPPLFNKKFSYAEVGETNNMGYAYPLGLMTYSFPCDFDLLSDLLNGVNLSGKNINTVFTVNPMTSSFNTFGSKTFGCGIGSGNPQMSPSNVGSASEQESCPDNTKLYLPLRQARMMLLEQDKIAFRCTIPWNPSIHAGKVISINLQNREDQTISNYGSGDYLIVSMKHNLKYGGFSTTTMDCVSVTVGGGEV